MQDKNPEVVVINTLEFLTFLGQSQASRGRSSPETFVFADCLRQGIVTEEQQTRWRGETEVQRAFPADICFDFGPAKKNNGKETASSQQCPNRK